MPKDPDEYEYGTITYVRIPPELREEIDQKAREETRTINGQIIYLLRKALQSNEQPKNGKKAAK